MAASNFHNNLKEKGICISCKDLPARSNRTTCEKCAKKVKIYQSRYWKTHKKQRTEAVYIWRDKVKVETFEKYGGPICKCCGESEVRFLEMDHMNDDGAKHRREMTAEGSSKNIYLWLKKHNYPNDLALQVLCSNCNKAKWRYGVCPHKKCNI